MKITILVDNISEKNFKDEHGFSLLLEIDNKRILLDTGKGDALFHNVVEMGVKLNNLDAIVLSHGHYDHGGNLASVLDENPQAILYVHPESTIPRYSIRDGIGCHSIALSHRDKHAIFDRPADKISWCNSATKISDTVWVTGEIPRSSKYPIGDESLFLDPEGVSVDTVADDMSLWIETDSGLVIISGCCHSGLENTIDHIKKVTGENKIRAVIGGFHMSYLSEDRNVEIIKYIKSLSCELIVPAHCTGRDAAKLME